MVVSRFLTAWGCIICCFGSLKGAWAQIRSMKANLWPNSDRSLQATLAQIHGPGSLDLSDLTLQTFRNDGVVVIDAAVVDMRHVRRSCGSYGFWYNHNMVCAGIGTSSSVASRTTTKDQPDNNEQEEEVYNCCSRKAIEAKVCEESTYGRLIYNPDLFVGQRFSLSVAGASPTRFEDTHFPLEGTGRYALVVADCQQEEENEKSTAVILNGNVKWKSSHGYLHRYMYRKLDWLLGLFGGYSVLLLWYGGKVYRYRQARIPAEEWILGTIFFGFLALLLKVVFLSVVNRTGIYFFSILAVADAFGACKQAASRTTAVFLAMGEGFTRHGSFSQTSKAARPVVRLGVVYVVLALLHDLARLYYNETFSEDSPKARKSGFATFPLLSLFVLDLVFFTWVNRASNRTVEHLAAQKNRQVALQRYKRHRSITRYSVVAVGFICLLVVETGQTEVPIEVVYLACFLAVARLWRPDAPDYYAPIPSATQGHKAKSTLDLYSTGSDDSPVPQLAESLDHEPV